MKIVKKIFWVAKVWILVNFRPKRLLKILRGQNFYFSKSGLQIFQISFERNCLYLGYCIYQSPRLSLSKSAIYKKDVSFNLVTSNTVSKIQKFHKKQLWKGKKSAQTSKSLIQSVIILELFCQSDFAWNQFHNSTLG